MEAIRTRGYSFIDIKAMDEDKRIIEGIASTPSTDRMDDVVVPEGAKFKLPLPFLWQHNHREPIGHVIDAKVAKTGISFVAQIPMTDEPGRLKEFLDYCWQSKKLRLVSAVSIGFSATKYAWMDNGGIEFLEWDWYELSAVTIPANPDATINSVKSFDALLRANAGVVDPVILPPVKPAASGKGLPVVKLDMPAPAGVALPPIGKIHRLDRLD